MTDHNSIIHIGAAKCGSSSLQAALSRTPVFKSEDGRPYSYVAIDRFGRFHSGRSLVQSANSSPYGYMSCANLREDPAISDAFLTARNKCQAIIRKGRTLIFSNEGWYYAAGVFKEKNILPEMGLEAKVIMFIRPPLDWVNSAWWQWGVWTNRSLERWVKNVFDEVKWDQHIESWMAVPGVSSVEVRLTTDSVVDQFFALLGAPAVKAQLVNSSLSPDLLRFFQRNREFRQGPHESRIEFVLNRWVTFSNAGSPWVLPAALQQKIIEEVRPHNERLLSLLAPAERDQVQYDPRWWSAQPYADREVHPVDWPGSVTSSDAVIRDLIDAIVKLDAKQRARHQSSG